MRDLGSGRVRYNRHDFKRGIDQPQELTCRSCGADLGTVPVQVWEEVGKGPLIGYLEPGETPNGVVLRVMEATRVGYNINCGECSETQNLVLEDWYLDPEATIEEST